jgi:DNA polymerase III epsilon subunit-like protein
MSPSDRFAGTGTSFKRSSGLYMSFNTHSVQYMKMLSNTAKRSLGDICKILGIEADDTKLHGAAYDVEMTRLVAKKLRGIELAAARDIREVRLARRSKKHVA